MKQYGGKMTNFVGVGIMTEKILSSVEEFVCRLYGVTQTPSVDATKHRFFSGEESQKICHPQVMSFSLHVKRFHDQVMIWNDAHYGTPV